MNFRSWPNPLKVTSLVLLGGLFVAFVFFGMNSSEEGLETFTGRWFSELNQQVPSQGTFSLKEQVLEKKSAELADLEFLLPHYHLYPAVEIRALMDATQNCETTWQKKISANLEKAWLWQKAVCKQASLPVDFFERKPFLHPSGKSYVVLNEDLATPFPFPKEQRSKLMSLAESLQEGDSFHKQLAENFLSLELLLNEAPLVVSGPWVFAKDPQKEENKTYSIYPLKEWNAFFVQQPYQFQNSESFLCLEKYGGGCWVRNQQIDQRRNQIAKLAIAALIFILWLVVFWAFWRQARLKKSEEERRKFTLQMLTHELRTPVTSLLLLVENMRDQFDRLPAETQKDLLKLMDQTHRLKRTAESSEIYLKMDHFQKNSEECLFSVSNLLKKLEGTHQFQTVIYEKDLQLSGHAELLEFCLSNLLRNAERHGKAPVTLSVTRGIDDWVFEVKDEGISPTQSLTDLSQAFVKNERSQGLGLGLALVSEICKKNHWQLSLKTHPTRFSIHLSRTGKV